MAQEHDCTCFHVKGDDLKKEISTEPRFEYEYPPPPPAAMAGSYQPIQPKLMHERSDDELLLWLSLDSIEKDKIPKIRKYFKQLHESEGFDIDEMPGIELKYPGSLSKCPCCRKCYPEAYDKYMNHRFFFIGQKKGFNVLEVNSVNGYCYSLSEGFNVDKAGGSDPACKRTFQAVVVTGGREVQA